MLARDIGTRTVGPVDGAKDRVFSVSRMEALLDMLRRDAPGVPGLMTGDARTPVGSHTQEERVRGVDRTCSAEGADRSRGIGEILQVGIKPAAQHRYRKAKAPRYK